MQGCYCNGYAWCNYEEGVIWWWMGRIVWRVGDLEDRSSIQGCAEPGGAEWEQQSRRGYLACWNQVPPMGWRCMWSVSDRTCSARAALRGRAVALGSGWQRGWGVGVGGGGTGQSSALSGMTGGRASSNPLWQSSAGTWRTERSTQAQRVRYRTQAWVLCPYFGGVLAVRLCDVSMVMGHVAHGSLWGLPRASGEAKNDERQPCRGNRQARRPKHVGKASAEVNIMERELKGGTVYGTWESEAPCARGGVGAQGCTR